MSTSPELPTPVLPVHPRRLRERSRTKFLYQVEFALDAGTELAELLESERDEGPASRPRDPRLTRAIRAAARGWVVERYVSSSSPP